MVGSEWMSEITKLRERLDEDVAALRHHKTRLKDTQRRIKEEKRLEVHLRKCRVILQTVALKTQKEITTHINNMTSMALDAVFDDPHEFEAIFKTSRNETAWHPKIKKNGRYFNPVGSGGVADITAFGLRISVRGLIQNRAVISLDEPFKFADSTRHPYIVDLLRSIHETTGLQIIMVTHIKALENAADKVITIKEGKVIKEVVRD